MVATPGNDATRRNGKPPRRAPVPAKGGTASRTHTTSTSASTDSAQNAARQPTADDSAVPAGIPAHNATVMPADTTAIARPRCEGGTIRAAHAASIAHSVPPITPAPTRAANVTAYTSDTAVTAFSTANPASTTISTGRRGNPRSNAVTGIAATNDASAYALTR
ncbi:hypothetical protein OIE66_19490 [Nonomuraea sp. NBC_01738]|nr:hypothetical protein OIE66_19490 [Nonomuraea sp. NBC_01738]